MKWRLSSWQKSGALGCRFHHLLPDTYGDHKGVPAHRINQSLVQSEIHTIHMGLYQLTHAPLAARMFLGIKASLPRC